MPEETTKTKIILAAEELMLAKGFQIEPLVYLAIILGLVATRIKLPVKRAVA